MMAFFPLESAFGPWNWDECTRVSPLKSSIPAILEGNDASPLCPVAWIMCRGWIVPSKEFRLVKIWCLQI